MGYCRRVAVIALIMLLLLDWDELGAMDSIFHIHNPHSYELKLSAEASSVASETTAVENCGKLCRFSGFHAMLVKGPVPPSGPSHRGNSVPSDR